MSIYTNRKHPSPGGTVKIEAVSATEQAHRVQDAIAHRAFEIFQNQGAVPGHELEHWQQAETELASSRCSGQMVLEDSLWVSADAALFEPDSIEIWVAPKTLTICGKPHVLRASWAAGGNMAGSKGETIFHRIDLACEVNPARVNAKFDDAASLEIVMGKAGSEVAANREVRASAA